MSCEKMNSNKFRLVTVRCLTVITVLFALLIVSGCARLGHNRSFINVAQPDLRLAMKKTSSHLVHVTIKKITPEKNRRMGTMVFKTPASTRIEEFTGITVAEAGYVLVPAKLDQDAMKDLSVWIGEDECEAEFISYEKQLGMSIIQVKTEEKLPVLSLSPQPQPPNGQWLAVLSTSGENAYFIPRTGLYMICGHRPTLYPELVIDGIGTLNTGAPLFDRDARPVGIIKSTSSAVALSEEFCMDLSAFIEESLAGKSEDDDKERLRLGICLHPVIKEHAKFLGVPGSALWVTHVLPDSPADKDGLRNGDLILAVDGEPLRYSGKRAQKYFNWRIEGKKLEPFSVTVWRDGTTTVLKCMREHRPSPPEFQSKELGMVVREIDENAYAHKNLTVREGVLVTQVLAGSPASTSSTFGKSLIWVNDVIVELNGVPTPDISSFRKAVEDVRMVQSHAVLLKYRRGRVSGYAGLNLNIGSISNGAAQ